MSKFSIKDILVERGVVCPEHGVDYHLECERCHQVTRDYVVRNGLYIAFMKLLLIPFEPKPWNAESFLFYVRDMRNVHGEELKRARREGDREGKFREDGYLQALNFVIDALLEE